MPWPFPTTTIPAPGLNAPRLVRLVEPAADPVSLAEAKLWLRIDVTEDDALLSELIKAARSVFEQLTGRILITTSLRAQWDYVPRVGTYAYAALGRELELPVTPLLALSALKYTDENGAEQTYSAANYSVEAAGDVGRFPRLVLNATADWPTLAVVPGALRAEFTAGYGADATFVPAEIKVAVKLLLSHLYQNRLPVNVGNIVNELPWSLTHLIQQHQVRPLV